MHGAAATISRGDGERRPGTTVPEASCSCLSWEPAPPHAFRRPFRGSTERKSFFLRLECCG
jgi:hypothetical protein